MAKKASAAIARCVAGNFPKARWAKVGLQTFAWESLLPVMVDLLVWATKVANTADALAVCVVCVLIDERQLGGQFSSHEFFMNCR